MFEGPWVTNITDPQEGGTVPKVKEEEGDFSTSQVSQ